MQLSYPKLPRPAFHGITQDMAGRYHESGKVDHLTERGAIALAKRLTDYWFNLGYTKASFWHELNKERDSSGKGNQPVYVIKCNLINGIPPR